MKNNEGNSTFCRSYYVRYIFNVGKGPFWSKMEKERFALKVTLEKERFAENIVFESTFSWGNSAFWIKIMVPVDSPYN